MAKAATAVDLQPIDRLEDKVRQLVTMVERLRADATRLGDDNARLQGELDALRARVADAEGSSAELGALREERELIKGRVTDLIAQIDRLGL